MSKTTTTEEWKRYAPPLLGEIAEAAAEVLQESLEFDSQVAADVGYYVMRRIVERVGGSQVYIPKADSIHRSARDELIWQGFSGDNHRALSRQFGVSEIHIYRLIKVMRERERNVRQAVLF